MRLFQKIFKYKITKLTEQLVFLLLLILPIFQLNNHLLSKHIFVEHFCSAKHKPLYFTTVFYIGLSGQLARICCSIIMCSIISV